MSFSDMDVRALTSFHSINDATPSTPGSPHSPLADGTTATFSVEAFALCVQAFIRRPCVDREAYTDRADARLAEGECGACPEAHTG